MPLGLVNRVRPRPSEPSALPLFSKLPIQVGSYLSSFMASDIPLARVFAGVYKCAKLCFFFPVLFKSSLSMFKRRCNAPTSMAENTVVTSDRHPAA